jgi:hypothetical protein
VPAAGGWDELVVGVLVTGPELALAEVALGELPVLFGIVDAGLEAAGLLLIGDVEEELEEDDVVVVKHALELDDVFDMLLELAGGDELVDAGDEDVLVVGAVEDFDHAAWRDLGMNAPEEIVPGFERGRFFEGCNLAALRVDPTEDMADGPIFACGIHALKDNEERLLLTGEEDILQIDEFAAMTFEYGGGGILMLEGACVIGRDARQVKLRVVLDQVR